MKAKMSEIVAAHLALSKSTLNTLEVSEQSAVFKLCFAINVIVKDYETAEREIAERLHPDNEKEYQALASKVKENKATQEETVRFVTITNAHNRNISKHLEPLLAEEYDVSVEPIAMCVWQKVFNENNWTVDKMLALGVFTKPE